MPAGWGEQGRPSVMRLPPPQLIPQISSLSWFTTVVPLCLVLTVSAAKDATDDVVSSCARGGGGASYLHWWPLC